MIVILLINIVIAVAGIILGWLPVIDRIPNVFGYDIDAHLVSAVGQFNSVADLLWPLHIMFQGFLVLMGYHILMITLRFFLGSRAP